MSGTGSARTRCQQYSPFLFLSLHSISNAPSIANALAHSAKIASWSSGWVTFNQPPLAPLSRDREVLSIIVEAEREDGGFAVAAVLVGRGRVEEAAEGTERGTMLGLDGIEPEGWTPRLGVELDRIGA